MWLSRVRRTVTEHALLRPGARVLLGLSGGPDSAGLALALGQLAPELGVTLYAASIDHGLRPDAADDVELARQHAAAIGAPFATAKLTLAPGPDLSARARVARYEALFELARDVHAEHVAVGHTMDDQAETVLMRLLRGSSIRGLRGIAPGRGDGVVRPLLHCARQDVHAAVRAAGWAIADDPSNQQPEFLRARVRGVLLPALLAEDARVVEHLAELASDAAHAMELVEAMATGIAAAAQIEPGRARIEPLRRAPVACRREALAVLAAQACGVRPSRAQLLELERLLRGRGEVWLTGGHRAFVQDGELRVERSSAALHPSGPLDGGGEEG